MKGIIVNCLQEMVDKMHGGQPVWQDILKAAGLDPFTIYSGSDDVADGEVLKLFGETANVLNISLAQAEDGFGEYWVCHFAPRIYEFFYRDAGSAKAFINKMGSVHLVTTESMPNVQPPQFEYDWQAPHILILRYISQRGLIDLFISLLKGVGKYYQEDLQIKKLSQDQVEIIFPPGN